MLNKLLLANGVLTAGLIWATRDHFKSKATINTLTEDNILLIQMVMRHQAQIKYLQTMMEQQEIEIDEFDLIMLNDPM